MKYATVSINNPRALRIQSIGIVLGTPAAEIKEGDFLMWNFGSVYKINSIISQTEKMLTVSTSPKGKEGEVYTQKFLKTRLVCILEK